MKTSCNTCKWADISDGDRTIVVGDITVHQKGKGNIQCKCPHIANITMDFGRGAPRMSCSGYEKKE